MTAYRTADIALDDGRLRIGMWESDAVASGAEPTATVLAIHGITASHMAWGPVAERLTAADGFRVVAPDLRGRGRSASLPGPWGMTRHAADLAGVLAELGAASAVVVGHSMGGFAAVVLAAQHPSLVRALVLVDGGLPIPLPEMPALPKIDPEEALRATLGPAAERLSMTFPTVSSYRDFWRVHPALGPHWCEAIERYVDYDLVGEPPRLQSSVSYDALAADAAELSDPAAIIAAWRHVRTDSVFLRAPLGLLAQPPGLYPSSFMQEWAAAHPNLSWSEVPEVNHYTITLGAKGAAAIATAVQTVARLPAPGLAGAG